MRDTTPSKLQKPTAFGGNLNILPMTYRVSDRPIGDEARWGLLAYVTEKTREKIIASGYGEMRLHLEHIKRSVGYVKKMRAKLPTVQLGFDLGE